MTEVYIGLGSNLDEPIHKIYQARQAIVDLEGVTEVAFSSLYSSPPMGPQDQPDYVNAVMCFDTHLTATDLLKTLQAIESNFGRIRTGLRWGARTLDLDILLYADEQINVPDLIVPHIGIAERAFVLYPLAEIAPNDLVVPAKGLLTQLVLNCPKARLEKIRNDNGG